MTTSAVATKPKPTIGPLVPESDLQDMMALDRTSKAANQQLIQASQEGNEMAKGLIMARSIQTLRGLLTEKIMSDVMLLMNNPLGFKTDKDPSRKEQNEKGEWIQVQAYPMPVVRDVLIQALIRGFRPTGNEFNIIAGQFYGTKEGYERLLKDLPGLTELRIEVGVPKILGDKGSICDCKASWRYHGQPGELLCEGNYAIPIKVNKGMGTDAIQGKAQSKMLRRIYKIITNIDPDDGDQNDPSTVDGQLVDQSNSKQAPGS